jgi:hypothetical protein
VAIRRERKEASKTKELQGKQKDELRQQAAAAYSVAEEQLTKQQKQVIETGDCYY